MSYGDPRVEPRRIPPIDLCHLGTADGTGHEYVAIRVLPEQRAPVRFTFFWTGVGRWEGRDFQVGIDTGASGESSSTRRKKQLHKDVSIVASSDV